MSNNSSVFAMNNLTNTSTAVPDAGADNHIPTQGSAATWNSITSNGFLAGPKPGQDQSLIRSGDQTGKVVTGQHLSEVQKKSWTHTYDADDVREFDQNRDVTITKNEKLTIIGDRTIQVNKNIDESGKLNVKIKAGVELTLEGPGGSIKIDASGVTIQGVLVKIN